MMKKLFIALAFMVVASTTTFGACKIRLLYGEKWSRAGRDVKKTLSSSQWKQLASSKYSVEFVDDSTNPKELQYTFKEPAIFVYDEKGRCFCVIESVPYNATPKYLFTQIDKVNKRREEIMKKYGTDSAEGCGELLASMEKFVTSFRRNITDDFFYGDIFKRLQQLDPRDETGWLWHFTFGTELDRGAKRDGLEYVIKANDYRERIAKKDKTLSEAEAYLDGLMKRNKKRLTTEQKQALLMAEFALHRENPAKKEELIKKLEKISDYDENTLWGTCALGWLNLMGRPALSTYWGWKEGDIPVGKIDTTVKFGVGYAFRRPGRYTIELIPNGGTDPLKIDSITLMYKDEEYKKITKAPFEVDIDRQYAGKLTSMVIKGQSAANTSGKFRIHRQVLRPRKKGK